MSFFQTCTRKTEHKMKNNRYNSIKIELNACQK